MPKMQIPKKLLPLVQKKKRFKVVIGGRGSGKSQTVCDIALMDAQTKGIKTGCFREFMNSIADSVMSLLLEEIDRLGLQGFSPTNNEIKHDSGGYFAFKGLARNIESIKSMSGFQRFIIEEAQTMSAKSIEVLTPTLREEDSEIWLIANPGSRADPFSERFIVPFHAELLKNGYYEDDLHLIIVCNYKDNPFFPQVLEDERLYDYENKPRALYNHIWLGDFNDSVDNALIKSEWFDAAIDAHKKLGFEPRGMEAIAHDPSDLGPDSKGLCHRYGSVILNVIEMENGDVNEGFDWALGYAITNQVDAFIWDGDGMGVGGRRQVSEALAGKKIEASMFRGSESPEHPNSAYEPAAPGKKDIKHKTNKDTFKNRRAQAYWLLRDRFYKTYLAVEKNKYVDPDELISLSSDIESLDKLRSELCRIPVKPGHMIQILSKEEMKRKPYQLPSPNLADSVMMSEMMPDIAKPMQELEFTSLW